MTRSHPSKSLLTCNALVLVAFLALACHGLAADDDLSKREKKIVEARAWLTNQFEPWLTNTFPDITSKPWPEWFVNPPSRTRLPTFLTNTFLTIDTEEFPVWFQTPEEEMLAKGIPDFWKDVQAKVPLVPQAKNLPAIVRGPYLQMSTTNSIVIRWRTDQPNPSVVKFGKSPDKLSKEAKASGTLADHVVLLTNLQPDTKYYYSIGTRDVPLIVQLTNRIAMVGVTNGTLYVSTRATNIELASVANSRLTFSMKQGRLSYASADGKIRHDTTNTALLVSTLTSLMSLTISNGALVVGTSDQIMPMDGGEVVRKRRCRRNISPSARRTSALPAQMRRRIS
jgi:hypothetical protein